MNSYTFISYSRREYYFTESLVLNLQNAGVDVWFDIQQLEPGIDWQQDIQRGLAECQSLTLVASKASLASPYVRQEWEAALKASKPIVIVLFESVRLPRILRDKAQVVDFRTSFQKGLAALTVYHLRGELPPPVSVLSGGYTPGVRAFNRALLLYDTARHVQGLLLLLMVIALLLPGSFPQGMFLTLLSLVGIGNLIPALKLAAALLAAVHGLGYLLRARTLFASARLRRRDFQYADLIAHMSGPINPLPLLFPYGLLTLSVYSVEIDEALLVSEPAAPIFRYPFLIALGVGLLGYWVLGWLAHRVMPVHPHDDLLRWSPNPGSAPQAWRAHLHRGLSVAQLPPTAGDLTKNTQVRAAESTASKRFAVLYAPGDALAADAIRQTISVAGYSLVSAGEEADAHALILSFRTPLESLKEWATLPGAIGFITTDLRLPVEESSLKRTQLVDVRQGYSAVDEHLRYLVANSNTERRQLAVELLPTNLKPIGVDPRLDAVRSTALELAGTHLGFAAWVLLRLWISSGNGGSIPATLPQFPSLTLGGVVLAIIVSLVSVQVAEAARRGRQAFPTTFLVVVMMLGLLVPPLLDLSPGDYGFQTWSAHEGREPFVVEVTAIPLLLISVAIVVQMALLAARIREAGLVKRSDPAVKMPPLRPLRGRLLRALFLTMFAALIGTLAS